MTSLINIAMVLIEKNRATTSFVQARFCVGYAKAQKIVDELEELGVISARDKTGNRQVLATVDQLDTIFANYEPKSEPTDTKSVTIMKYQAKDGSYGFIVKDKFDIADAVERLGYMNGLRDEMLNSGEMKKHLWTKETVLF